MNPVLEVDGVVKRLGGRAVLDGVSLRLPPRGVTVLLGPNGAGKSTLLRVLLGVLAPDAGRVRVLGLDPVRDAVALRRRVGYVPDQPDVPAWMTPRELFRFLSAQYPAWSDERAAELASAYALPLDTRFAALSLGQAARAMLAAALAPAPSLLLLDECFAGLDPLARRDLLQTFVAELMEHDVGALVATHDLDVAARIADRVLVLANGKLAAQGDLADVLGGEADLGRISARLFSLLEPRARAEVSA
jgi:ABC-2 type transport system ATP-binding protein